MCLDRIRFLLKLLCHLVRALDADVRVIVKLPLEVVARRTILNRFNRIIWHNIEGFLVQNCTHKGVLVLNETKSIFCTLCDLLADLVDIIVFLVIECLLDQLPQILLYIFAIGLGFTSFVMPRWRVMNLMAKASLPSSAIISVERFGGFFSFWLLFSLWHRELARCCFFFLFFFPFNCCAITLKAKNRELI